MADWLDSGNGRGDHSKMVPAALRTSIKRKLSTFRYQCFTFFKWLWFHFTERKDLRKKYREYARGLRGELEETRQWRNELGFVANSIWNRRSGPLRLQTSIERLKGGNFALLAGSPMMCGVVAASVGSAWYRVYLGMDWKNALITSGLVGYSGMLIGLLVGLALITSAPSRSGIYVPCAAVTFLVLGGVLCAGIAFPIPANLYTWWVGIGCAIAGGAEILMWSGTSWVFGMKNRSRLHFYSRNPHVHLLYHLWEVWFDVNTATRGEGRRSKISYQLFQVSRLDLAAIALESMSVRTGRYSDGDWLNRELRRRGNAIREWKKAVLLPKGDSPEWLLSKLETAMLNAVRGRIDELDVFDVEPVKRLPLRVRAFAALKGIVIASAPIGVLLCAKNFAPKMIQVFETPILIFTLVWAFYHLLLLVEPKLGEKLNALGEFARLLRLGKP
jgi:hypothetical protein